MKKRTGFTDALILLVIAALTYLPLIHQIGYTHDDWYLMASAKAEGAGVFQEIYSVDRPLRAYVLTPAYMLFGENVLYYNLSAWCFRVLSALFLLWIFRRLWPDQSTWVLWMALLYVIYPGFLSQPNGIDYQAQMVSLALATLSLALTVHAFFEKRPIARWVAISISVITGILYLGLVEYEIGFELLRLLLLFMLAGRITQGVRVHLLRTLRDWFPYTAIFFIFGIWRVFFFESERGATDVNLQFSQLRLYPLQTIAHWGLQVAQDFLDVTVSAWVIPLSQLTGYIQRWGGLMALLTTGVTLFVWHKAQTAEAQPTSSQTDFNRELPWLGVLTIIGGLLPIAMVNRDVWFPAFSRYSLVSSVGVVMLIVAIVIRLNGHWLRYGILGGLLFIAMLVHHGNTIKNVGETAALRNFWWQVAWRVPQFEKNSTLMAYYPGGVLEEDYFVWGPATLIYYPEKQKPRGIQPGLFAAIVNRDTVAKVLARERQEFDDRKNIITYKNYRNVVILTQPSPGACLHVIDGTQPEFSRNEWEAIRVIGPYSELEHVLTDATPHLPPEIVFGPEPARGWCYYYQKVDLARQKGDWASVISIGDEAFEQGLAPTDPIEWMPFAQAYARIGDTKRLTELAPTINADTYIAWQACRILGAQPDLRTDVFEIIDSLYCPE